MKINKAKLGLMVGSAFLMGALSFLYWSPGYIYCSAPKNTIPRIAHAGGGYKSLTYTDSIEALNANSSHYDLFEIDFNITSDNKIVCIHDWDEGSPERTFGVRLESPPTYTQFEQLVRSNPKYQNCTLSSLIVWLEQNPNKRIVTDVKNKNLFVLSEIATNFPNFRHRFIPQIYDPSEYNHVKSLGYDDIIFTIYKYGKSDSNVLRNSKSMNLFALTMPIDRAKKLAPRASCIGIPTYAHTINSEEVLANLKNNGIIEVYTDWLKAY